MPIEICTIGGYSETGKNCTAIKIDNEVILVDLGLHMENYIRYTEEEDIRDLTYEELLKVKAVPDLSLLKDWKKQVTAIILSHGHYDHLGATPFAAHKFPQAPIICTPYTAEVLRTILRDERLHIPNKIIDLNLNSTYKLSENISLELINVTHSIPQASLVALHTKYGTILYANDYKFDRQPTLGKKPNFPRLEELGNQKVLALICESVYAHEHKKMPSESVARQMLKDVLLGVNSQGHALIVTTFSSHLARLKSIIEMGKKLNRRIVFLGRSLSKYVEAGEKIDLINFKKDIKIIKFRDKVEHFLRKISKQKDKYLLVVTGHQGEPRAILPRIARKELKLNLGPGDLVVFSCSVIPVELNRENRRELENQLKNKHIRIFKDIHVSVLPDTPIVVNNQKAMKIEKIKNLKNKEIKTASFDPKSLKINWHKANLIKHPYRGKIFSIKTKSGRSVDITSGHSVFVLSKGQIKSIKGDDLKIGDYVVIPKSINSPHLLEEIDMTKYPDLNKKSLNYKINDGYIQYNNQKICPRWIKLTPEFGRLLGYYLAEGCAPRHISLVLGDHEEELIKEILNLIKIFFPGNISLNKRTSALEITFGANILKRIFKGWFRTRAKTKRIPQFIFSANKEVKLNFLGAYINGDGTIEKRKGFTRIRIKTASKELASDLLYLFSQVNICAKFDHEEVVPQRIIAGNRQKTKESRCYVIRIQGWDDLKLLCPYLSQKFQIKIKKFLSQRDKPYLKYPPEALPTKEIDLNEVVAKKHTYLEDIKRYNHKKKKPSRHVRPEIIKRDAQKITGFLKKIIEGNLLFDPVKEIQTKDYQGEVYDLEVPGTENFLGGFGGILLHNSGHAAREDHRDLIELVKPKHIIPSHTEPEKAQHLADLAVELGYKQGETVHLMDDGKRIVLS